MHPTKAKLETMENEIRAHQHDAKMLEKLYRTNKQPFKRSFGIIYPELQGGTLAEYWYERLNYKSEQLAGSLKHELLFIVGACLLAGLIAKLPVILNISEDVFYQRNIGFILIPVLSAYFALKQRTSVLEMVPVFVAMLVCVIFINILPYDQHSDTVFLSCSHIILLLWYLLGFSFVGNEWKNVEQRLNFLKYNGDVIVITTLILIAGAIMSVLTIGLFSLIGFSIEKFYFEYIAIIGLVSAPIVGTYLTQVNPLLVGKVSPVIARIFSPMVLTMLVIYLIAIIYSGKNPYTDRDFLLIFNAMLIGVMAIIFFSISDIAKSGKTRSELWILALLSMITIIVNCIALSAILFRIAEWGITPNRLAVLGGNCLILVNLLLVAYQLFQVLRKKTHTSSIGKAIALYLPVYFFWTIIVTFLFPFIFDFQ